MLGPNFKVKYAENYVQFFDIKFLQRIIIINSPFFRCYPFKLVIKIPYKFWSKNLITLTTFSDHGQTGHTGGQTVCPFGGVVPPGLWPSDRGYRGGILRAFGQKLPGTWGWWGTPGAGAIGSARHRLQQQRGPSKKLGRGLNWRIWANESFYSQRYFWVVVKIVVKVLLGSKIFRFLKLFIKKLFFNPKKNSELGDSCIIITVLWDEWCPIGSEYNFIMLATSVSSWISVSVNLLYYFSTKFHFETFKILEQDRISWNRKKQLCIWKCSLFLWSF